MGAPRGAWLRSSNRPGSRGCRAVGHERLYEVGFDVILRVDACRLGEDDQKQRAAGLPEKYR